MVTLTILALLGGLYVLIVFPWPVPLLFRLFLGLIVTWPMLSLYLYIELPSGVPDLHYHRAYFGLLVIVLCISAVLTRRYQRTRAITDVHTTFLSRSAEAISELSPRVSPHSLAGGTFPSSSSEPFVQANPARAFSNQPSDSENSVGSSNVARQQQVLPIVIQAYVLLNLVAVINGFATGVADSTAISGYIDTTLLPVGMYFLTKKFIVSRRCLVWLLGAMILTAFIVCLTGLYERALDLTDSAFAIDPFDEAGNTRYLGVPGGRAAGVVGSPAVYGGLMGLGILSSLACLVHAQRTRTKLLLGSVALVMTYGVIVTYTRSAWISVAIALLFAQFFFKGLWKVTMPLAMIGGLAVVFMWAALQQNDIVQDRVLEQGNVIGRIERIAWSWERFLEHPVFGRGPNGLNQLMLQAFPVDGFSTSHNTHLTMLVDSGILVYALFWVVIFRWLRKAASVLRSKQHDRLEYSAVAAMVGFLGIWLMCGMSLELRYFTFYTVLFWIAGATIERLHDQFYEERIDSLERVTQVGQLDRIG